MLNVVEVLKSNRPPFSKRPSSLSRLVMVPRRLLILPYSRHGYLLAVLKAR